jgi:hypothetical protein
MKDFTQPRVAGRLQSRATCSPSSARVKGWPHAARSAIQTKISGPDLQRFQGDDLASRAVLGCGRGRS